MLLFLDTPNPFYQEEGVEFSEWQGVLQGAKYFFEDDDAFLEEQFNFEGGRDSAAAGDAVALIGAVRMLSYPQEPSAAMRATRHRSETSSSSSTGTPSSGNQRR